MISISLSYTGALSDNNMIDMYDAARGLVGFHRSLALTTHLLINGEIITQAPSLKGAQIITTTPEEGSWKVTAVVLAGLWAVATPPKESIPGHLLTSAYDYVIKSTLGFHVDFSKTLGLQYEEMLANKKITSEKMDSLIEKTESSIGEIHRPIVASETATEANISGYLERQSPIQIGPHMTRITYEYLARTIKEDDQQVIDGAISSYNLNTHKGRIFVFNEFRPIPFELATSARSNKNIAAITASLSANATRRTEHAGAIRLKGYRLVSTTGRLKALVITSTEVSTL